MSSPPRFHIREAETTAGDGEFIIAAFDSTLPYLTSIGSHEQWGSTPFSERYGWAAETMQQVRDAETYRLTGKGDALRIFIVEAEVPTEGVDGGTDSRADSKVVTLADEGHGLRSRIILGQCNYVLPVGFAFVRENDIPKYILTQEHFKIDDADRDSCVYIEVMVADHRVSSALRKGSGAALIKGVSEFGKGSKKRCLFIDGWAGNEKKLIDYYDRQGFQVINDFSLPRKEKAPWVGTIMKMDVS